MVSNLNFNMVKRKKRLTSYLNGWSFCPAGAKYIVGNLKLKRKWRLLLTQRKSDHASCRKWLYNIIQYSLTLEHHTEVEYHWQWRPSWLLQYLGHWRAGAAQNIKRYSLRNDWGRSTKWWSFYKIQNNYITHTELTHTVSWSNVTLLLSFFSASTNSLTLFILYRYAMYISKDWPTFCPSSVYLGSRFLQWPHHGA